MKLPSECNSLEEIRTIIDSLDQQIISMIGKRFQYVKEVMRFKSNKTEVVAQTRFDEVIADRRSMAEENGLSPDVMEKIYRTLLQYFIEEEYKILDQRKKEQ